MRSFAHRPVTVDHPPEPVTADNWKKYAVGQTGKRLSATVTPSACLWYLWMRKLSWITRQVSVSCLWGTTATWSGTRVLLMRVNSTSAVQRNIRANHLAVVANARGGSTLRIGDAKVNPESKESVVTCSAAPIVLNTDAWSEEARAAAIEARKRKGKSSEEEEPERLNAWGQNAETAKRVRAQIRLAKKFQLHLPPSKRRVYP